MTEYRDYRVTLSDNRQISKRAKALNNKSAISLQYLKMNSLVMMS